MENTELKPDFKKAPIYWMHEAIAYLGLDRLGLARPDKAIYRLVKKGALHPKKIAGHFILVFTQYFGGETTVICFNGRFPLLISRCFEPAGM